MGLPMAFRSAPQGTVSCLLGKLPLAPKIKKNKEYNPEHKINWHKFNPPLLGPTSLHVLFRSASEKSLVQIQVAPWGKYFLIPPAGIYSACLLGLGYLSVKVNDTSTSHVWPSVAKHLNLHIAGM